MRTDDITGGSGGERDPIADLLRVAAAIGKYGVTTVIFALPLVVACFGLYILWVAINSPVASMAKISVGIFVLVFGSCLLIVLLREFDNRKLWKKLAPAQEYGKKAAA